MPFVPNTASGALTIVSDQVSQQFDAFAVVAAEVGNTPNILMRGNSKLRVIALQDTGAVAAQLQVQTAIGNSNPGNAGTALSWFNVGPPILTPLNTTMNVEYIVPGKFVRLQITAPAGNATEHEIAVMLSQ